MRYAYKDLCMIHLILLSGGSGKRLWPLSNESRSKQFLKVLRDEKGNHVSMIQRVFGQIAQVPAEIDVTIATGGGQETSIRSQLGMTGYNLVLEPERRDTAPAIMLACAYLDVDRNADHGDTVVVMPIDTYADQAYYNSILDLDEIVQNDDADLVLLGVEPTYPSEKYGYIVPGSLSGNARKVAEFKEKPNVDQAATLIARGALWNCGVFAFKLGFLRALSKPYLNLATYEEHLEGYSQLPKNSFDYEVVEHASSVAVVPYSGMWKDLGTWNTLTEEMSESVSGRAIVSDAVNVHVVNETGLPMVVSGISDAVVVATHDGILACSKVTSTGIKDLVEAVSESRPMYEKRRWGEYRVLDSGIYPDGAKALTKELVIKAGCQLSYQRHSSRAEYWTIVSGSGQVVLDGLVQDVRAGSSIKVPPTQLHAARAFDNLHIIEVQVGSLLEEEDIERFGNYWHSEDTAE